MLRKYLKYTLKIKPVFWPIIAGAFWLIYLWWGFDAVNNPETADHLLFKYETAVRDSEFVRDDIIEGLFYPIFNYWVVIYSCLFALIATLLFSTNLQELRQRAISSLLAAPLGLWCVIFIMIPFNVQDTELFSKLQVGIFLLAYLVSIYLARRQRHIGYYCLMALILLVCFLPIFFRVFMNYSFYPWFAISGALGIIWYQLCNWRHTIKQWKVCLVKLPAMALMIILLVYGSQYVMYDPASEKLEAAYQNNSPQMLEEFFSKWQQAYSPAEPFFLLPPEREIYEIYKTVYVPMDPRKLGDWEPLSSENNNYKNVQYIVVQGEVLYRWPCSWCPHTLKQFRPEIGVPANIGVLYLTPKYRKTLLLFLGATGHRSESSMAFTQFRNKYSLDKTKKMFANDRNKFLLPYVRINSGHWGGWQIESHPLIEGIELSAGLTEAYVSFRVGYQGGTDLYVKRDGVWVYSKNCGGWNE